MTAQGADPGRIELVCMDMSKAFRKGAARVLPQASVVFDRLPSLRSALRAAYGRLSSKARLHVMQMASRALDVVSKLLQREGADLKGSLCPSGATRGRAPKSRWRHADA